MDKLWEYYNDELIYLRQQGAEFAKQHPDVAAQLAMDGEHHEDPHVSRLLEGVAFLTARIRANLDHDFPELTQSLIDTLYPDYRAPIPAQSIVQFHLVEQAHAPVLIQAGSQLTTPEEAEPCLFHVSDDVSVLPATLNALSWQSAPVQAPKLTQSYQAVLQGKITPFANAQWETIEDESLRFYINAKNPADFTLYRALLNQTVGIALEGEVDGENQVEYLPPSALQPHGLDHTPPGLDGRSSATHHQLSDFFLFPKRFLFVDLTQLINPSTGLNSWKKFKNGFTFYVYCKEINPLLNTHIGDQSLMLGCAPIVNLFKAPIVPIPAKDVGSEAPVQVDPGYSTHAEVYRLTDLTAHNSRGEQERFEPFYGVNRKGKQAPIYWTTRRESAGESYRPNNRDALVNTFVSLVDDEFAITGQQSDWIIEGQALCINRQRPRSLPYGPNDPVMALTPAKTNIQVRCLTRPTPARVPPQRQATRWQLVHSLSLQSFAGESGLQVLKDTLRLYSLGHMAESESHIDGLVDISLHPATALIPQGEQTALCRGTHIHLTLSDSYSRYYQCFLFGSLLHRFFASICAINSFTQLSLFSNQQTEPLMQWPPHLGKQPTI